MGAMQHAQTSAAEVSQILKTMNPALRDVFDQVVQLNQKVNQGLVVSRWQTGSAIESVLAAEDSHDTDTFGEHPAARLAKAIGLDRSVLYRLRNFARAFPEKYVRQEMSKPGNHMDLTHWLAISQFEHERERHRLVKRVQSTGLTAKDLLLETKSAGGKKATRRGGREQKIPTNPVAAWQKLNSLGIQLNNYEAQAADWLTEGFLETPVDNVDPAAATALIDQTIATLTQVRERADHALARAEKAKKTIQRRFKGDDEEASGGDAKPRSSKVKLAKKKAKKRREAVAAE